MSRHSFKLIRYKLSLGLQESSELLSWGREMPVVMDCSAVLSPEILLTNAYSSMML